MCDDSLKVSGGNRRQVFNIVVAVVLGYGLLCLPLFDQRRFTCFACRLERVDHRVLVFRWSDFRQSECSRWYADNVERTHSHVWAQYAHCRRIGLPGLTSGFACSTGDPISGLSGTLQLRAYQNSREPIRIKRLFIRMGTMDAEGQRLMEGLCDWANADYPGDWEEWLAKHRGSVGGADVGAGRHVFITPPASSSIRATRWPCATSTKSKSDPPTRKNAMIARIA